MSVVGPDQSTLQVGQVAAPPPREAPKDHADPLIGCRMGAYAIIERIGRGGMGTVYRAEHVTVQRMVALKVINADRSSRDFAERFTREARTAAMVTHQHVVRVYEFGEQDGRLYLVSEFVEGRSLRQLLEDRPLLPWTEAVPLIVQALGGLQAIADAGLVHRDIKPDNILIGHGGIVKITDFGLAKGQVSQELTVPGQILGTPAYLAPEQWEGSLLDHRTDQFGLGVTAYLMLTGMLPFPGKSPPEILVALRASRHVPPHRCAPGIPQAVSEAVMRMLRLDPAERFPDPAACSRALLDAWGSAGPVQRVGNGPTPSARQPPTPLPQDMRSPPPESAPPPAIGKSALAATPHVLNSAIIRRSLASGPGRSTTPLPAEMPPPAGRPSNPPTSRSLRREGGGGTTDTYGRAASLIAAGRHDDAIAHLHAAMIAATEADHRHKIKAKIAEVESLRDDSRATALLREAEEAIDGGEIGRAASLLDRLAVLLQRMPADGAAKHRPEMDRLSGLIRMRRLRRILILIAIGLVVLGSATVLWQTYRG